MTWPKGEHIDYALFGVLPAAVERDILIACAPRSSTEGAGSVVADNLHPKYTKQSFTPMLKGVADSEVSDEQAHAEQWHLDIDTQQLRWESYVKAGYYVRTPPKTLLL